MDVAPGLVRTAAMVLSAVAGVLGVVLLVVAVLHLRAEPVSAGLALLMAVVSFSTLGAAVALARLGRRR